VSSLRFFILIHYFEREDVKAMAGRVWRVKYYHIESGKSYENDYEVRTSGDDVLKIWKYVEPVDVHVFVDRNVRYYLVDIYKVQCGMYALLKSVYNSLRYCRTQLRYGRQPDKWWLLKKLIYLVNGFACARWGKMSVPVGLRKAFEVYVNNSVESLLEYIRNRYLQNIDGEVWSFVKRYVISFTSRMWWLF